MRFSVIIPAYNCKTTLSDTVDSIIESGLNDFEVILVDDGSTDGTAEICNLLCQNDGRIKCKHVSNGGVSFARNCGIRASRGEYILFCDADDTVEKRSLAMPAQIVAESHPDMLIFGMCFDYYHNGKCYRRDDLIPPISGMLNRKQWEMEFDTLFQCNALSPVWNKLIKREILLKQNISFSSEMIEMEDFLFSVNVISHCESVYVYPKAIYHYSQEESERATYRRLTKIKSISTYMNFFEDGMKKLQLSISEKITEQIYMMFLYEILRYGSVQQILNVANDMGNYAATVEKTDPILYRQLSAGHYRAIWLKNATVRLRHWIAIRLKYLRYVGGGNQ